MALDIVTQDLIIDESIGFTDDDKNPAIAPYATDTLLGYLLGLDSPGGLATPEFAHQTDFVIASADAGENISAVALAKDMAGNAFSKTDGVLSTIRTVDGNYVWLFQDATHANVVIGVIGSTDPNVEPAETGPLAFSFALVPTSATHADLYTVQYVALSHPDITQTDERIDLTNLVYASVTGTTTVSFTGQNAAPGNHEFYIINSPTDAAKQILVTGFLGAANAQANVSTQGFGVNNQSINPTERLQVDFVTGGTLAAGTASQIQYASHIETITSAGFTINQITPSNPNLRVDITIGAYNVQGNEQGVNFWDGSPTTAAPITSIKLTGQSGYVDAQGVPIAITADGTYNVAGSIDIVVSGMGTNEVTITGLDNVTTVDINTSSPLDRLTITGADSNEGLDVTEFHFSSQTPNASAEQIGSFINFDDSGPDLSITGAPVVGAASVTEASGSDGANEVTITDPTFTASAVDGYTTAVTYELALVNLAATGLVTTQGNKPITLVVSGDKQTAWGKYDGAGTLDQIAFTVALSDHKVTLTSSVALEHSNSQTPPEDNTLDLNGLLKVVATVTVTDGDEDVVSQQSSSTALSLTFVDTDPTLTDPTAPALAAISVVEASNSGDSQEVTITAPTYTAGAVDGASTVVNYALALVDPSVTATGLMTTDGNKAISLVFSSGGLISGMYDSGNDGIKDATAFTVTLTDDKVKLTSLVALEHNNSQTPPEDNDLDLNGLIKVVATVTVTDGDEDVVSKQSSSSALSLTFVDTDPVIDTSFDADPGGTGDHALEHLGNGVGQTADGAFGYSMTDQVTDAEYTAGWSDFANMALTGYVNDDIANLISGATVTRTAETTTSASFDFSFSYDRDPITTGVQAGTAGGTLVFDKTNDTYTFTMSDVVDGFSFDLLQTAQLVAKQPTGNNSHPLIVAEQLTEETNPGFFVQFTGDSTTQQVAFGFNSTGDGAPVADDTVFTGTSHDLVSSTHEDWVSATQSTNGVAGDTIQKGELLTLRFFAEDILGDVGTGNERLDPTTKASGVVVKFDGIGNSEDLIVILDLKDANGNEITRAINVQNGDLIKGNANIPSPYNTKFTLDNNDALLIIERNDYNGDNETYQIQGMQIMQSANGLTGMAIDLDGAIGDSHGSTARPLTAWDLLDNDVLKIVDIGFVQNTSGTIDANLDFAFNIVDGDGDMTSLQHIAVQISDTFMM